MLFAGNKYLPLKRITVHSKNNISLLKTFVELSSNYVKHNSFKPWP
jgi:hypothetical protein